MLMPVFCLSGRHVQRLRHLPLQTPPEVAARARPLVLRAAGQDGGVLLLQERGEQPMGTPPWVLGVCVGPALPGGRQTKHLGTREGVRLTQILNPDTAPY